MPYNSLTSRTNAAALIPEEVQREIVKGTTYKSIVMQKFKTRRMGRAQTRIPVLSLKATAYFVSGDTGLKQTTELNWTNKYLDAEEIAVIVPIPENLLDDQDYDLWGEVRPEVEEAIAVAFDDAVLFGTNKPASWPTDLLTAATSAGNAVTAGTSAIDVADDLNNVMIAVESDGYPVNGMAIRPPFVGSMRGLRDSQKQPIFQAELGGIERASYRGRIWNVPADTNEGGLTGFSAGTGNAHALVGDWRQGIVGIRQDVTMKMLDQAVIQDNTGAIIYNLPQQDMVAARFVMRAAFQVPNPPNRVQSVTANRYPFGVLKQA